MTDLFDGEKCCLLDEDFFDFNPVVFEEEPLDEPIERFIEKHNKFPMNHENPVFTVNNPKTNHKSVNPNSINPTQHLKVSMNNTKEQREIEEQGIKRKKQIEDEKQRLLKEKFAVRQETDTRVKEKPDTTPLDLNNDSTQTKHSDNSVAISHPSQTPKNIGNEIVTETVSKKTNSPPDNGNKEHEQNLKKTVEKDNVERPTIAKKSIKQKEATSVSKEEKKKTLELVEEEKENAKSKESPYVSGYESVDGDFTTQPTRKTTGTTKQKKQTTSRSNGNSKRKSTRSASSKNNNKIDDQKKIDVNVVQKETKKGSTILDISSGQSSPLKRKSPPATETNVQHEPHQMQIPTKDSKIDTSNRKDSPLAGHTNTTKSIAREEVTSNNIPISAVNTDKITPFTTEDTEKKLSHDIKVPEPDSLLKQQRVDNSILNGHLDVLKNQPDEVVIHCTIPQGKRCKIKLSVEFEDSSIVTITNIERSKKIKITQPNME
jgi:hypothetical protein